MRVAAVRPCVGDADKAGGNRVFRVPGIPGEGNPRRRPAQPEPEPEPEPAAVPEPAAEAPGPSPAPVRPPTAEQAAAIDSRDRDIFLEAGAGTGKTRVLVDRYCDAVDHDGVEPERILAFTFTEKACLLYTSDTADE